MRRLIAIPGFALVAIGSFAVYLGFRVSHVMAASAIGFGGSFLIVIGVFLVLLSGIFDGILEKRWGPGGNGL
jgi:hypothetical protein